jgi:hypothetical protein
VGRDALMTELQDNMILQDELEVLWTSSNSSLVLSSLTVVRALCGKML